MTYTAHIKDGQVIPDRSLDLPDGTVVEIVAIKLPSGRHHPDVEKYSGILSRDTNATDYMEFMREKHS